MSTPVLPPGTEDDSSTVEAAAKLFEGRLFPAEGPTDPEGSDDQDLRDTAQPPAPEKSTPEAGAEPESEPEPEAEPDPNAPPTRARKLRMPDGTEAEVSEDEAYLGYLRQQDYTRKTQIAAEQRKAAEAREAEARTKRDEYAKHLEAMKQAMDALVPQEPDWDAVRRSSTPEQYAGLRQQWDTFSANKKRIEGEQARIHQEQAEAAKRDLERVIADEEDHLLNAVPEWRDRSKFETGMRELAAWLKDQGFSEEQIGGIVDHRVVLALRDTMRYRKLQERKPAAQSRRPPLRTLSPGSGTPPAPRRPADTVTRARERLQKTGKVSDAAAVFADTVLKDI